jgi:type II secretory pathway pseudopilin PulG
MKKILLLALVAVISMPAMPQSRKYQKKMRSAIEEINEATDAASELTCAASFEEIAEKYPDQWLPSYHAAKIILLRSLGEPDAGKKEAMLDRARKSMDMALAIVPDESEVQVLKALYYIGLITVDPNTMGELYYQDVLDAIQRSKSLNMDNPRAWYLDGIMTLNMPEFLGGGPEAARPILEKAAEKFKAFQNDDPFWPDWGEELNRAELDRLD